jgi:multiple sugar transport system ATP-binding protein
MTVYQNMAFGLKLRRFPKAEIETRVRRAAEILGIVELLDRKPKALSGGQRQRVAVGRAIVREPQVFLFDEPLSNLDAKLRVQMRLEIAKLHARLDTTMIYVTHDQVEAMTMGDRIVVMNDGVVQQVDDPLQLYNNPRNLFVAGFIGSPPMNFIQGRCELENGQAYFNEGTFRVMLPDSFTKRLKDYAGKEVVFGVRPEDILAANNDNEAAGERIMARVEVVEPMGAELYVHLNAGKSFFIARFPAQALQNEGGEQPLRFQLTKVHLFDPQTTQVIV